MQLDIRELRERGEPLLVRERLDRSAFEDWNETVEIEVPIEVDLVITVAEDLVRVQGTVSGRLQLTCSRCLKYIPVDLNEAVDLDYVAVGGRHEDAEEVALQYEDLNTGFYRDEKLELWPIVGEQALLRVPMKPVCSEQCKGLCDQCGADLNLADCGCDRTYLDPRLEGLLEVKKQLNRKPN